MDVIGDPSICNGLESPDDECVDTKPIVTKHGIVGDAASTRVGSSGLALRVPVDNLHSTGTVSYRLLPLKVDNAMDSLSESESTVPIAPLLATQITSEGNEPRLALISSSETTAEQNQTVVVSGGQFYLISESANTAPGNRTFIPRTTTETVLNQRMSTSREEKRRVTHNEVERRRRDKINNWICRLAKILPECSDIDMQSKTSQVSKGVILAKACDCIEDLRKQIRLLTERVTLAELKQTPDELKREIEILKTENNILKNDNALLKAQLHQQVLLEDPLGS